MFYNDLQTALLQLTSTTIVIVALVRCKCQDQDLLPSRHPLSIPTSSAPTAYTKGDITNKNGSCLIQYAAENNLFITTSKFRHKTSSRSTWSVRFRPFRTKKKCEIRKNHVRNQIDDRSMRINKL